jgi:hypothetical protein
MSSVPASSAQPSRPLTRNDYKTLSLSALGGALEFYDFIIFPSWRRRLDILGPCKRQTRILEGLLCQNAVGYTPADLAEFPFSTPYEKRIERCMLVLKRFSRRRLST